jgi:glycerol-3-phosphate acyltransferase PlsX
MGVIRLAVDAMGGDHAPAEIVAGAIQGARDFGLGLSLVGDPDLVYRELSRFRLDDLNVEVVPACDVIRMDEEPSQAIRSRPEATINVACRLVLEGRADGVLTMGHTGAGMVAALFNFGRLPGLERPAAIVPFLGLRENLYLLDIGANSDVRPRHILQFAQMGAAYAEHAAGIPRPRVGLLSNGSEPNKGNKVGREAYALLAAAAGLNFIGNVEAHSLLVGEVNVVVSDGFAGNILLKTAEGLVAGLLGQMEALIPRLPPDAAEIVRNHLGELRACNHYARYGAAALLGVQHPIFIGHGRSKALAVRNGMATARRMIATDVVGKIRQALAE